jgi:hypothetical protein
LWAAVSKKKEIKNRVIYRSAFQQTPFRVLHQTLCSLQQSIGHVALSDDLRSTNNLNLKIFK